MAANVVQLFGLDEYETGVAREQKPETRISNVSVTGADQPHRRSAELSVVVIPSHHDGPPDPGNPTGC